MIASLTGVRQSTKHSSFKELGRKHSADKQSDH